MALTLFDINLDLIEAIAVEAGDAIMRVYENTIDVSYKDDKSPLTEADLSANRVIVAGLKKHYPEFPILTEEAVGDFKGPSMDGYYWLVDPLDGTKEFIKKNGEFTVNIALIYHGVPVLGVVLAPAKGLTYRAQEGEGAWKREGHGELKKIQVSLHKHGTPWKVMGSRSHGDAAMDAWLLKLGLHELVPMGSSLKVCLIAEGFAHVYPRLGPTRLWDTAAAHAILKEAGGEIRTLEGEVLSYGNPSEVLNPFFIASCHT
jgi:3'(2'), 5'-bisphosphate nucleotidase